MSEASNVWRVDVGGHHGRVTVEFAYAGFAARSSLHLDDRYVEPLTR